jgi:hypothetical protein
MAGALVTLSVTPIFYPEEEEQYEIAKQVSLLSLIANPEKFHGSFVITQGYLNLEFEGNALYVNEFDYKNNLFLNSVWVDLSEESKHNKSYVTVGGYFSAKDKGHLGLFSGSISSDNVIYPTNAPLPQMSGN